MMSQSLIEQCSKGIPINQFLSVWPLFLQEAKSVDLRNDSPARAGEKEHERKWFSRATSYCNSKSVELGFVNCLICPYTLYTPTHHNPPPPPKKKTKNKKQKTHSFESI